MRLPSDDPERARGEQRAHGLMNYPALELVATLHQVRVEGQRRRSRGSHTVHKVSDEYSIKRLVFNTNLVLAHRIVADISQRLRKIHVGW